MSIRITLPRLLIGLAIHSREEDRSSGRYFRDEQIEIDQIVNMD